MKSLNRETKTIAFSKTAAMLIALFWLTFLALEPAFGQMGVALQVQIPYQFFAGSKMFPAGSYTVKYSSTASRLELWPEKGHPSFEPVITQLNGPSALFRDGSLVFDKTDKGRILAEVWIPGINGLLLHGIPKGDARDTLLVSELSESQAVPGKTAFHLTCARCHGADGKGNEDADKFFNTTIPRLNSVEVQSKTDAELKEIITQGTNIMPPVEIDESGFRHRLPAQDVEAVIAYVRTLKK